MERQRTVAREVSLRGVGLHTGKEVTLRLQPAAAGSGVVFVREDLPDAPRVRALVDYVVRSERNTTLNENDVCVLTPEHLMAAIWLTGLDNVEVVLSGEEVPIMDGSATPFVELIEKAGLQEQEAEREYFTVREPIEYVDAERGVEVKILPAEEFKIDVLVNYDSDVVGYQYATYTEGDEYKESLAPCRTFVFFHELEMLHAGGLIRGGSLSNALVVVDKTLQQADLDRVAKLFGQPSVEVSEQGYLSARPLQFTNELARHKLLDTLGDLVMVGVRLRGHVVARRSGHKANTELAKLIRKAMRTSSEAPYLDLNAPPVYDTVAIEGILPHRPPFLLVDKVMELGEDYVIGVKNVTMNEPFFVGHFPGAPVMPGVLQIEAMAQVGGILVLSMVEDPENYLTYFLRIDKARFRQQVVPGDTLVFHCVMTEPMRRGLAKMRAQTYVGRTLVSEAELMAQITKRK